MTSPPATTAAPARALVGAAMVAYMGLGLPEAALGVTFPEIQKTFDVELSAIGLLLLPYTAAYILASLSNGRVVPRLGSGMVLMLAAASACVGAAVYVVGPAFAVLMVGSLFLGASAGALDATLNAYVSVHLEHRFLSFMHGGFGIGATLGPLGVTALLAAGASWRVAYALLAILQVALLLAWLRLRSSFVDAAPVPVGPGSMANVAGFEGDVGEAMPLRPDAVPDTAPHHPLVPALNVGLFFLYSGTEVATGLLIATLLVERGAPVTTAGYLASAYWFALTVGRFINGAVGTRLSPLRALAGAVVGALVGLSLVAFGGVVPTGLGLVVLGFSLAPIFPSLVALTPSRVGVARTPRAIGYQLAGASVGVTVVPGLVSLAADRVGTWSIGPCLLGCGVVFAGLHLATSGAAGELRGSRRTTPGTP